MPRVSVLMPTYNRRQFLPRAIESLLAQTYTSWDLWIIDDGSTDGTAEALESYRQDKRIRYVRLEQNRGLGAALNAGLERAEGTYITYLPSDDVYYPDHLATLMSAANANPRAALIYSGVRYHYNRTCPGIIEGNPLQLVQVLHRRTADRWTVREELVSDDYDCLFWRKIRKRGETWSTGKITCEWVEHPGQLSRLLREPKGGINLFRRKFNIQHPMRFRSTMGNYIDEVEHYRAFRERPNTPAAPDGLKILLVGELAYNAERVLALEERGHQLYGLWMEEPYWYNTVGPLPFGHVTDLPRENWQAAARELQPDVIYALLNWQAVPFVRRVLAELPEVPAVWHFKEGPFICLEHGMWGDLLEIYARADGHIFSSPEMRQWFETVAPQALAGKPNMVLDGDLPKREWLAGELKPRLSARDGQFHTVVPGRPIGLHPENVAEMAAHGIHLHFYGNFTHGQWVGWIQKAQLLAPGFLHLHDQVDQDLWVSEFSQYDAGWLHFFKSQNGGDVRRANWDDLNIPARLSALALAGLPVLQGDNSGALVASQNLVQTLGTGLFFNNMAELREQLGDSERMEQIRANAWANRERFTFDYHADELLAFFRRVIEHSGKAPRVEAAGDEAGSGSGAGEDEMVIPVTGVNTVRSNGGISRSPYDYLIVGAGFAGSVLAERLAAGAGLRVLVIDRRPHIGGNAYDYYNRDGILVHQYGPHIFHTNSAEVFAYLSRFTDWHPYEHRVLASVKGMLVPMPINLDTLRMVYQRDFTPAEAEQFLASRAEQRERIRTSEDVVLSRVGRELYELFFRGYTRKQWGLDPSELDAAVTARLPVRFNRDDRYFSDVYQAMPLHGYTRMFERMLDHPFIQVMPGVEYSEAAKLVPHRQVIFTGPVDEYFDYRLGPLPYRSLHFEFETLPVEEAQPVAVINYPNEHEYTRVTEFKHLTGQQHPKTTRVYEYPRAEGDPYYPIPRPESAALYAKYKALAEDTPGVHFAGRLGTYKYYNMDQVVAQALTLYANLAGVARGEAAAEFTPSLFPAALPVTGEEDGKNE